MTAHVWREATSYRYQVIQNECDKPGSATAIQRIARRKRKLKAAEMYLRGMTSLTHIAHEPGVHKSQISRDFKIIKARWREQYTADLNTAKQRELAKIDSLDAAAWEAWERSCADAETLHSGVLTTAPSNVRSPAPAVNTSPAVPERPTPSNTPSSRPRIDFAFLRSQITLEHVLRHLGLFESLQGRAPQLCGCCPFHEGDCRRRTLSVHLDKNVFHCFHANCQAQGNALDFWARYRGLPIYEAAVDLAATFRLPRNREEATRP